MSIPREVEAFTKLDAAVVVLDEVDVVTVEVLVDVETELVVLDEELEVTCDELEDDELEERKNSMKKRIETELELTRSEVLTLEVVVDVDEELTLEVFEPRNAYAPTAATTTIIMTTTATTTVAIPRFGLKSKIYALNWQGDNNRCSPRR